MFFYVCDKLSEVEYIKDYLKFDFGEQGEKEISELEEYIKLKSDKTDNHLSKYFDEVYNRIRNNKKTYWFQNYNKNLKMYHLFKDSDEVDLYNHYYKKFNIYVHSSSIGHSIKVPRVGEGGINNLRIAKNIGYYIHTTYLFILKSYRLITDTYLPNESSQLQNYYTRYWNIDGKKLLQNIPNI
jgi:hypothetical protein